MRHNANGMSKTKLYKVYHSMIERTMRTKDKSFKNYGGRGIKVCDEWLHDFMKFYEWSMAHGYKEGLSIDRIDVNGNYEPSNCRWIPMSEQSANRRTNHYITIDGQTKPMMQVAREHGVNYHTLFTRLSRGWTLERALATKDGRKEKGGIK